MNIKQIQLGERYRYKPGIERSDGTTTHEVLAIVLEQDWARMDFEPDGDAVYCVGGKHLETIVKVTPVDGYSVVPLSPEEVWEDLEEWDG